MRMRCGLRGSHTHSHTHTHARARVAVALEASNSDRVAAAAAGPLSRAPKSPNAPHVAEAADLRNDECQEGGM